MRTQGDRVHCRNLGFETQMTAMVDAYMIWNKKLGDLGLDSVVTPAQGMAEGVWAEGFMSVHVLDMFHESFHCIVLSPVITLFSRLLLFSC